MLGLRMTIAHSTVITAATVNPSTKMLTLTRLHGSRSNQILKMTMEINDVVS